MTQIIVVERTDTNRPDLSVEETILGPDVELVRYETDGDEQGLASACRDAEVILADLAPLTRTVVEQASRCRLISVSSVGYESVDIDAASEAGISVCAIDEYCTDEVADHAMLLMLALIRQLPEYNRQIRTELLWQADSISGVRRLSGMTLGIIGFGKIGQAVARRASGFGMTILAHDYSQTGQEPRNMSVGFCDLPTLLAESDVISLNCSLTAENANLIDESAFNQMKRRPFLINCARGGLVDEPALVRALDSGQISGAGLDVLAEEPPNLGELELNNRPNVILTPHAAYYSDSALLESREKSARNIRHFLDGKHELIRKYIYQAHR